MRDNDLVESLRLVLNVRFTAEELCEILGLTVDDLFDRFTDEILQVDWDEHVD